MNKSICAVALLITIAGFITVAAGRIAPAQEKNKDKDNQEVKEAPEESGKTEVYMAKDGWRFRIKSPEGKSIAVGTVSFDKKEDCLKAVDVVKTALAKGKVIEIGDEKK
jgi:uncharacterized protein YegP (UPF0339 family)